MAVRGHRYSVTLEHLAAPNEATPLRPALSFEAVNHDDVIAIAERTRERSGFAPDEAAALAVGLKLFSEVMLKHRDDPLFAALRPHMREFVGKLKARNRGEERAQAQVA